MESFDLPVRAQWATRFLSASFCLGIAACGPSSHAEDRSVLSPFPEVERARQGLTIVIQPFAARGSNVHISIPRGEGLPAFRAPENFFGFHWPWTLQAPSPIFSREIGGHTWQVAVQTGTETPSLVSRTTEIQYKRTAAEVAEKAAWPAVLGGASGRAASFTLPLFFQGTPANIGAPLRVYFLAEGNPLVTISTARSCGNGCLDFENFAEALDTPITTAMDESSLAFQSPFSSELPFVATWHATPSSAVDVRKQLQTVHEEVRPIWDFLVNRWGEVAAHSKYQTHILINPGCSYQGFEHYLGTLISIGSQCSSGAEFANNLRSVVIHEMIHVWNGKHIFPAERAQWNAVKFAQESLAQLYFYEGMTEGFARIAIAQFAQDFTVQQRILAQWNESLSLINRSLTGAGLTLESISQREPRQAYHMGAFLALRFAGLAKETHGEAVGQSKFWGILRTLNELLSDPPTDRHLPIWKSWEFLGRRAIPTTRTPRGYTKGDILQALESSLALPNWPDVAAEHFGPDYALANQETLRSMVGKLATLTQTSLNVSANDAPKLSFLDGVTSKSQGTWPF